MPWLYDADDMTDKPERFIVSELIREQVFRLLGEELPYGTGVMIDQMQASDTMVSIKASIIVSRPSHKPIVIGKKAHVVKEIGTQARKNLEQHFDKKVFLELFVKVDQNWTNSSSLLQSYQLMDDC